MTPKIIRTGVPSLKKLNKKFAIPLLGLLFLSAVSVTGGYFWWHSATAAPSADSEEVRVVIEPGSSTEMIGRELKSKGAISNAFAFKVYSQFNEETKSIPPGVFSVPQNLSMSEVVSLFLEGPDEIRVVIPEGRRREEVSELLIKQLQLSGERAETFRREFMAETVGMEGYLFPDTYDFFPDVEASTVATRLRSTFDIKFTKEAQEKARANGLSLPEAVTLASIIERETRDNDPEERPIVAGIYLNRLTLGMPLQADATAQYAIASAECREQSAEECDWWPKSLSREDLQIDSSFNTYRYPGLPPAPIANPGLTALMAVSSPIDTPYLYYIHEPNGQIHYAETLEEHNENIANYLQ